MKKLISDWLYDTAIAFAAGVLFMIVVVYLKIKQWREEWKNRQKVV